MKRVIAIILAAAVLAACGDGNKLTSGEVTDKYLDPGHWWTQCTYTGKTTTCYPVFDDTDYFVIVEGELEGKTLTESHEVGVDFWNHVDDGDWWEE